MSKPEEFTPKDQDAAIKELMEKRHQEIQKKLIQQQVAEGGEATADPKTITIYDLAKTHTDDFKTTPFINLKLASPPVFIDQLKHKRVKDPRSMVNLYYGHASVELLSHLCNQIADLHLSLVALLQENRDEPESDPQPSD